MTRDPDIRESLDAVLAHLPRTAVPADLASRIVAHATALPQQMPREDLVVAVPDQRPIPARPAIVERFRFNTTAALALAASLALVFTYSLSGTSSPDIAAPTPAQLAQTATKPAAKDEAKAARVFARANAPFALPEHKIAQQQHETPDRLAPLPAEQMTAEEAPLPKPDADEQPAETAAALALAQNDPAPTLPKRPVQGPPVPDEFRYAPGESGTVAGFGVVGRGAAPNRAIGDRAVASGSMGLPGY